MWAPCPGTLQLKRLRQCRSASSPSISPRRRLTSSRISSSSSSTIPAAMALLLKATSRFPRSVRGINPTTHSAVLRSVVWFVLRSLPTGNTKSTHGGAARNAGIAVSYRPSLANNGGGKVIPLLTRLIGSSTKVNVTPICLFSIFRIKTFQRFRFQQAVKHPLAGHVYTIKASFQFVP